MEFKLEASKEDDIQSKIIYTFKSDKEQIILNEFKKFLSNLGFKNNNKLENNTEFNIPKMRDDIQTQGLINLCIWANNNGSRGNALEIGSYAGEAAVIFASYFKELTCIDPWSNGYDDEDMASYQVPMEFVFNVWKKSTDSYKNIKYIRSTSKEAASKIKEDSLDFIYIDGDHRYEPVKEDLTLYFKKVKKGGIIAGHDISFGPVQNALKDIFGENLEIIAFEGDSWCFKKI